MRGRSHRESPYGFTLVELLVVMAISAILVVAFGSEFLGWRSKYRAESDTKKLYSMLLDAKISALKEHTTFFVNMPPATQNVVRVYKDTDPPAKPGVYEMGDGKLDASRDQLVDEQEFRFAIDTGSAGLRQFRFDAQGFILHDLVTVDEYRDVQLVLTEMLNKDETSADGTTVVTKVGGYVAFGDYNCILITPPLYFGGGRWLFRQDEEIDDSSLTERLVYKNRGSDVFHKKPGCVIR